MKKYLTRRKDKKETSGEEIPERKKKEILLSSAVLIRISKSKLEHSKDSRGVADTLKCALKIQTTLK